jgi:hypothetical protein
MAKALRVIAASSPDELHLLSAHRLNFVGSSFEFPELGGPFGAAAAMSRCTSVKMFSLVDCSSSTCSVRNNWKMAGYNSQLLEGRATTIAG